MQRNGKQKIGTGAQMPHHQSCHRLRKGGTTAVFQPQHHMTRDSAVSDGCIDSRVTRRICQTGPAARVLTVIMIERDMAGSAPGRPKELQRAPAIGTKAMIAARDRTTAGTPWRQRK